MKRIRKATRLMMLALLAAGIGACDYVTHTEENQLRTDFLTWSTAVSDWANAIDAALCELEKAVFDDITGVGHTHPAQTPANRRCDSGNPDPVPPPPPPEDCLGC